MSNIPIVVSHVVRGSRVSVPLDIDMFIGPVCIGIFRCLASVVGRRELGSVEPVVTVPRTVFFLRTNLARNGSSILL